MKENCFLVAKIKLIAGSSWCVFCNTPYKVYLNGFEFNSIQIQFNSIHILLHAAYNIS